MLLYNVRKWGVSDMLKAPDCPFRIDFEANGRPTRPKVWVALRDYRPTPVVSQAEIAARLNAMSQEEGLINNRFNQTLSAQQTPEQRR